MSNFQKFKKSLPFCVELSENYCVELLEDKKISSLLCLTFRKKKSSWLEISEEKNEEKTKISPNLVPPPSVEESSFS